MTTVPEEAVRVAEEAFHDAWNNNAGLDNELPSFAMRAALTAALPHLPQGVGVKKLEWDRETPTEWKPETWKAQSLVGEYDIQREKDGRFSGFAPNAGTDLFGTLEAAKAAAQADYASRILSAIETVIPVSEPSCAKIEAARKAVEELAYTPMNLPLEDWSRISSTILSALEPSNKPGTFDLDQMPADQLVNISRPESQRALEPSAARELALEEALQPFAEAYGDATKWAAPGAVFDEQSKKYALTAMINGVSFGDFLSAHKAIRTLSSPDHADAGKVEGDGCVTYEVMWKGKVVAATDDLSEAAECERIYRTNDDTTHIVEVRTVRRPLPYAPSQEVAGS